MSPDNTTMPPAGWYADPSGAPRNQWWNGAEWTEHTMPNEQIQPSRSGFTPVPVRKPYVDAEWAGGDLSFGEAVATVFTKYAQFDGLARRSEYWWWYLFVTTVGFAAGLVDSLVTAGVLTVLWFFITFLPSLAVTIRRLRDAGYFWAVIFV